MGHDLKPTINWSEYERINGFSTTANIPLYAIGKVALESFIKVLDDRWYYPDATAEHMMMSDGLCHVNLVGSVFAKALYLPKKEIVDIDFQFKHPNDRLFNIINYLQRGQTREAYREMGFSVFPSNMKIYNRTIEFSETFTRGASARDFATSFENYLSEINQNEKLILQQRKTLKTVFEDAVKSGSLYDLVVIALNSYDAVKKRCDYSESTIHHHKYDSICKVCYVSLIGSVAATILGKSFHEYFDLDDYIQLTFDTVMARGLSALDSFRKGNLRSVYQMLNPVNDNNWAHRTALIENLPESFVSTTAGNFEFEIRSFLPELKKIESR